MRCSVVIAATLAFSYACTLAEDVAEHLELAKAEMATWEARFVTMRVRSRYTGDAASNVLAKDEGHQQTARELDWIWEDSGRFRDYSTSYGDGHFLVRSMRSADMSRYYTTSFELGKEKDVPVQVGIQPRDPKLTSYNVRVQPFRFLWDSSTRTWLGQRMQHITEAELTGNGLLEIDGDSIGFKGFVVRLDPKHSYLPISGEHEETGNARYVVEEFQEVTPGFWFPKRGVLDSFSSTGQLLMRWEIRSVELNQEYPAELFVPPMGDGTRVINAITGKQYWHGGKAPAPNESSQAQPKPRTSNPDPASATPETPFDWSWWLVGFGVVCVGVAIWIRR